jgi:hypothetical protein
MGSLWTVTQLSRDHGYLSHCGRGHRAQSVFYERVPHLSRTSELYDICIVETDTLEYQVANQACRAFIEATVQYHDEVNAYKKLKRLICYPASATIEDGKQAFLIWAKHHIGDKKLMAEQPVVGLMRSLGAKYPCKK